VQFFETSYRTTMMLYLRRSVQDSNRCGAFSFMVKKDEAQTFFAKNCCASFYPVPCGSKKLHCLPERTRVRRNRRSIDTLPLATKKQLSFEEIAYKVEWLSN
jgi:hypothetical protein